MADLNSTDDQLANKYRPLLVLFPEIEDGSERKNHHSSGHSLGGVPPLARDYHPRDIRLVLDNAYLPGMRNKPSREKLLDMMGRNKVSYIYLVDRKGPKDADKFWRVYAGIKSKDSIPDYGRKAYARVVRGSGRFQGYISIQYWLAYFYNDWANVHEMDWEMVSIVLKTAGSSEEPVACAYNAHIGSFRKLWKDVEKADGAGNKNSQGLHPVAYIGNGSHASYFSDYPPSFNVTEQYLSPIFKTVIRLANLGTDFTEYVPAFEDKLSVKLLPPVELIPEPNESGEWSGDWRWLNFKGNWGSPAKLSLLQHLLVKIPLGPTLAGINERPICETGPVGPNARPGYCWINPFNWINVECLEAEENRDWLGQVGNITPCAPHLETHPG